MEINKLIKKLIKKRKDKENLQLIKESGYFDAKYYLRNNPDVKEAGVNPLIHYYNNGWKEGRNPSQKFNTNKYLQYFGNVKENPIIHYVKYKEQYPDFAVPYAENVTVSNILKAYYHEANSLKTKIVNTNGKHRINLIYKQFNREICFGGKSTSLILAILLCNKYNYDLRIVCPDIEANIFYDFLKINNLKANFNVEFFSTTSGMLLEVSPTDDFICINWSSVETILNTPTITGKIFYLIQDAEFKYYGTGDEYLRSFNVFIDERIIPIVDSKVLYEFLISAGCKNIKNKGIYFEPAISKDIIKAGSESFDRKAKYNMLFYATPSPKENIFYFSLDVLNQAIDRGIINPDEWNIYVLGNEFVPTIEFDTAINVEMLEDISWEDYCQLLSNIDLCYGITYAPRPDYEILNAVSAGAVSVTNKNDNKQDLSTYSKNIIMADLNLIEMLKSLEKAKELVLDSDRRKNNYNNSNTFNTWDNAFKSVIEFIEKHLGE